MDYLKRSLKKLNIKNDYEEVDTKLASGWYVDVSGEIQYWNVGADGSWNRTA